MLNWKTTLHLSYRTENLNRHFSQVTKSRFFKNLNLRRKADRNFRGNLQENLFRHLKLYSNPSKLIDQKWLSYGHLWKDKRLKFTFHIILQILWKFTTKEDLNPQKQVWPLNLRLWLAQNPKVWSIFYGKIFI